MQATMDRFEQSDASKRTPASRKRGVLLLAATALLVWAAACAVLDTDWWSPIPFGVQAVVCFLVGYSVVSYRWKRLTPLPIVVSTTLGIEMIASGYAVLAPLHLGAAAFVLMAALASVGAFRAFLLSSADDTSDDGQRLLEKYAVLAGLSSMIVLGSVFVFSGRSGTQGYDFYGPMSRDHIFHLALIGRLPTAVPPDNFVVSGYPFEPYHFFFDVAIFLFHFTARGAYPVLDLYYRLYPTMIMFAIGFIAFWVPAKMHNSRFAGFIGAGLILFGANLAWLLGAAQTLRHLQNSGALRDRLFEPWLWTGVGTIYPLVHRPAHYHGLLILLCALAFVLGRGAQNLLAWVLVGLALGLLAGFDYPLAAVCGIAVALVGLSFLLMGVKDEGLRISVCAIVLALASIPANYLILLGGGTGHSGYSSAVAFSFGAVAQDVFAPMLGHTAGLWRLGCATCLFLIISYGVCLVGIPSLAAGDLNGQRTYRAIGRILASCFAISFALGCFFKYDENSFAMNHAILQGSVAFMAFFAVRPSTIWITSERRGRLARGLLIGILILIGPIQTIPLFNLGYRVHLSREFVKAMNDIKAASQPDDVVAFWPESIGASGMLGASREANNFYVSALTGLRSYFSVQDYTYHDSGEKGLYDDRSARIKRVASGVAASADIDLLRRQGVRWIVVFGPGPVQRGMGLAVWRQTPEFSILSVVAPAR